MLMAPGPASGNRRTRRLEKSAPLTFGRTSWGLLHDLADMHRTDGLAARHVDGSDPGLSVTLETEHFWYSKSEQF